MEDFVIEIDSFSFSIRKNVILKDVSLRIEKGDYVSIIGPNGAGKTTLLKCLIRIYTGGIGIVKLDGKSLDLYSQKELAKLISYVPQSDGHSIDFTVAEFVMMGRYPYLSPFSALKREDREIVSEALVTTGTEHFADRYLNTLSGGERQIVFIAAAIAQGSKIFLLDEPTAFLDPKHQSDIHKILKKINREYGITIVSVTHDLNNAVLLSDHIIVLKEGTVAFSGNAPEVMRNEVLEGIYDKTFLFSEHPVTGQKMIFPESI